MPLRLSPEHQALYSTALANLDIAKKAAIAAHDDRAAKRVRQEIHRLYVAFQKLELPPEPPSYYQQCWEREEAMSLEARIDRIEEHLKLGQYAENFGLTKEQIEDK